MMEWKEVRLGDYITIKHGYAFPGTGITTNDNNIVLVTPGNFKLSGGFKEDKCKFFQGIIPEDYILHEGDLIVTMTDLSKDIDTLGYSAIIPKSDTRTYLHNQRIGLINIQSQEVDKMYLNYMMRTYTYQRFIANSSTGTTVHHTSPNRIYDYAFKLPSIKIQRRIAAILSSLDRKIELNNKINAQLEEMAQAIFKSWFVDFEPFKVGADGSAPTYGSGKFVESELGMIPEGWRVGTLGEVADINPKRTLKKGAEATYLDMKNMPTSGSFPNQWEKKVMNGGMKFKNGDTLMARITPCLENGKVAYVNFLDNNEVGFGSTEYIVMTSKSGVLPEILYTLCRYPDFVAYATRNMNGSSGRQRVSGEVIGNYKIVIPPTNVVERLQPLFASIMEQIKVHGFESLHLSHLRDTLLPKLMSGEIEV